MENIDDSKQKNEPDQSKVMNITNNAISEKSNNNTSVKTKSIFSAKVIIIIGITIALIIALVLIIVIVLTKKKDKKKPSFGENSAESTNIYNDTETTSEAKESTEIETTIISNDTENITIESIEIKETIIDSNDLEGIIIDYASAEKIIDSETTKENHNLLNESLSDINELMLMYNNINFSTINATVNDNPKNLDFLLTSNKSSMQVAKDDLDLYKSRYASLSQQANAFTKEVSESLKTISAPLNEFKKEIDNITKQYEETIQNLAVPLYLYSNQTKVKLRSLIPDESLPELKNEIEKLNNFSNPFFKYIGEVSKNLNSSLAKVKDSVESLIDKVNTGISKFNENLEIIAKETIHRQLIEIKNSFISFKSGIDNSIEEFRDIKKEITKLIEEVKKFDLDEKNYKEIINNTKNIIGEIGKNSGAIISNLFSKIVIPVTVFEKDRTIKLYIFLYLLINFFESKVDEMTEIANVEISTSLDLLFIMDITGSMGYYISDAKNNILSIITRIVEECPGIDINLGFIGYRDFYEEYIDIDFTKNHTYLKSIISGVYASGGGDLPEDVAFALELALNKTWKNNARMAVFVADAPNHGTKYGGFVDDEDLLGEVPERRLIEEMIAEMAEENIALFCYRISYYTDKMFKLFENIYNETKSNNTKFQIVNSYSSSLSDVVVNYAVEVYNEQRKNQNQECLLPNHTAVGILKSNYSINNPNPDDNLRFIIGKCSPVLLVPGIYATKLVVELNCKGLSKYERDTTLKEIRLYCGYSICKDESNESEEHSLLLSLLDEAFGIEGFADYNHGACLGHIANYFQNENECPKEDNKNNCFYSKYVKVGYYGGTKDTLKNSRCGIEGITNIIQTGDLQIDSILNHFIGVSDSFNKISKNLMKIGYKEGFSLGGLPNDYRRYLATNNFATNVFKSQINRLYNNTGKPVIIIAHSYGTLLTLTNLLKNQKDKTFLKKIRKFIAMAPPFAGSSKLLNVFLQGSNDFNKEILINLPEIASNILDFISPGTNNMDELSLKITNYNIFGQYLLYKSLPTVMELRPLSIASKIFIDSSYNELGEALRDRLEIERECKAKDCDYSEIKGKTTKFDDLFKGYFPSLLDSECSYETNIGGNRETLNRKCFTGIYNVGNCPTIITRSENPTEDNFEKDFYCNKFGKTYFYQGECDNIKRNCLDQIYYSDKCPNVYSNTNAVNFLINRFNDLFAKEYGKINESYFDSYETIRNGVKNSIEHQKTIGLIKELPVPPVDTELLYGAFYPTIASLILDDDDFTKNSTIYKKGGDETVPTWSSLLTGLKWIYDKKKNNLTQEIKLVEYCSRLSKTGQYKYNPNRNQNFAAISCRCLDENNVYKDNNEIKKCSHAGMLQDEYLFNYIFSVVNDPKEKTVVTDSKKKATKNYNPKNDYVGVCNKDIYDILDTKK